MSEKDTGEMSMDFDADGIRVVRNDYGRDGDVIKAFFTVEDKDVLENGVPMKKEVVVCNDKTKKLITVTWNGVVDFEASYGLYRDDPEKPSSSDMKEHRVIMKELKEKYPEVMKLIPSFSHQ